MSTDVIVALVSGLFNLVVTFIGIMWAVRKFQTERLSIVADARNDNATAAQTQEETNSQRLDNYNRLFKTIMERDEVIIGMNTRIAKFEVEVSRMTAEGTGLRHELEAERRYRVQLAEQLEDSNGRRLILENKNQDLADEIVKSHRRIEEQDREIKMQSEEIANQRKVISELQAEVNHLKQLIVKESA